MVGLAQNEGKLCKKSVGKFRCRRFVGSILGHYCRLMIVGILPLYQRRTSFDNAADFEKVVLSTRSFHLWITFSKRYETYFLFVNQVCTKFTNITDASDR